MSVGVKEPVFVMQASAVGTAGLIGLLLARRRSMLHKVSYPVVASGLVCGSIYLSDVANRQTVWNKAYEIKRKYIPDTQRDNKPTQVNQDDSDKSVKR